jgi:hypothetical protein
MLIDADRIEILPAAEKTIAMPERPFLHVGLPQLAPQERNESVRVVPALDDSEVTCRVSKSDDHCRRPQIQHESKLHNNQTNQMLSSPI